MSLDSERREFKKKKLYLETRLALKFDCYVGSVSRQRLLGVIKFFTVSDKLVYHRIFETPQNSIYNIVLIIHLIAKKNEIDSENNTCTSVLNKTDIQ